MRALALIALLVAIAIPASAAEPWEGVYTNMSPAERDAFKKDYGAFGPGHSLYGVDACDLEPFHDLMPTIYSEDGIASYETGCGILKVTKIRNMSAWIFDVDCSSEGETWQDRRLVMLTNDPAGILVYYDHGAAFSGRRFAEQLYRCPF